VKHHLKLFHAYTACTRVTLTALEHVGAIYDDELLDMARAEHRAPEFLAINPQGKVPSLLVDGALLTENGAILRWLDSEYPEAGLFPRTLNDIEYARQTSDLFWLSSGWHPYVRAVKVPSLWTTGDIAPVRERGTQLVAGVLRQLEQRLAGQNWWYGSDWSIIDTYLWWACVNAEIGGFDLSAFGGIADWRARNEAHPALVRALAREKAALGRVRNTQS
jgi:glutathione S-transferase